MEIPFGHTLLQVCSSFARRKLVEKNIVDYAPTIGIVCGKRTKSLKCRRLTYLLEHFPFNIYGQPIPHIANQNGEKARRV